MLVLSIVTRREQPPGSAALRAEDVFGELHHGNLILYTAGSPFGVLAEVWGLLGKHRDPRSDSRARRKRAGGGAG